MLVVERVYHGDDVPAASRSYRRDTVILGWEARTHVHGRRVTDGGVEFGTSLPRGTVLREGDCFVLDAERLVVSIVARPEPVFVIEPRDAQEWARFAYHIGNRHQPLMITERALVCPDGPGVEALLQQHRMPYRRATQPFTPLAAVAAHQH
ncbi:MAG TPA: urease accessory protein UreE [Vicinamibacterales bacterium]|nr:urease accessory protein UreE [Vicinamibacterales bacterium]